MQEQNTPEDVRIWIRRELTSAGFNGTDELAEALVCVPATIGALLGQPDRNPEKFQRAIAHITLAVLQRANEFRTAADVHRAMDGFLHALGEATQIDQLTDRLKAVKVEGQRWVLRGVHDNAIKGRREARIQVQPWGLKLLARSLSGESRHKILMAESPSEKIHGIVARGIYDPELREPYWRSAETVGGLDAGLVYGMARIVLHLSSLEVPGVDPVRIEQGITDRDEIEFLLDVTKQSRPSRSDDEREALKDITTDLLWTEEGSQSWKGDGRPDASLYGYVGKAISYRWVDYGTKGILRGDEASRPEWQVFLARPESLDYLRERRHTQYGMHSGKPSLESYDGGNMDDPSDAAAWEVGGDDGEPRELTGSPSNIRTETEELRASEFGEIELPQGPLALVTAEPPELDAGLLDTEAIEWFDQGSMPRC